MFHPYSTVEPKIWMSGAGTLCANAHYLAFLKKILLFYVELASNASKWLIIKVGSQLLVLQISACFLDFTKNRYFKTVYNLKGVDIK